MNTHECAPTSYAYTQPSACVFVCPCVYQSDADVCICCNTSNEACSPTTKGWRSRCRMAFSAITTPSRAGLCQRAERGVGHPPVWVAVLRQHTHSLSMSIKRRLWV